MGKIDPFHQTLLVSKEITNLESLKAEIGKHNWEGL